MPEALLDSDQQRQLAQLRRQGRRARGRATALGGLSSLLVRVAQRDEAAFALLHEATRVRALRAAWRVVRDVAQAEEVVQEAYWTIWGSAHRFDPHRGEALPWLLTIVRRRAIDRVRSVEASRAREHSYILEHNRVWVLHEDRRRDAELDAGLDAAQLRRALAALSSLQRQALTMAYFGGYSQAEVATLLGVPLGTVKSRMRDGMTRLRHELEMLAPQPPSLAGKVA